MSNAKQGESSTEVGVEKVQGEQVLAHDARLNN